MDAKLMSNTDWRTGDERWEEATLLNSTRLTKLHLKCTRCGHERVVIYRDIPYHAGRKYRDKTGDCEKVGLPNLHYDCSMGCTHPTGLHFFIKLLISIFTTTPLRGHAVIIKEESV